MHKLAKSLLIAVIALSANSASASILVGNATGNDDKNDFTFLNGLITAYNDDGKDDEPLPMINGFIDKLEDGGFEDGILNLTDFNLFQQVDSMPSDRTISIFDTTDVRFDEVSFGADNPVYGFEQLSGPKAQYYVSKSGGQNGGGFSLWYAMDGLNPAYLDDGVSDNRGNIMNQLLAFAPAKPGLSHISFYSTGESPGVPEPSTFAVFALGGIGIIAGGIRRRRK